MDFSKASNFVPYDRLFTKLADWDVDGRVVVWVRELVVGRTEMVRVGGQLSEEVKVKSVVTQGSVLGTLLFIVYLNDIRRNVESSIRIFGDSCKIYRKIKNKNDIEMLQKFLKGLGERAVEKEVTINPDKCEALRFTRAQFKIPLGYCLGDHKFRK